MPAIYHVTVDHTNIKDRYRVTWNDEKNEIICSFEKEIEFTLEEKQWLWKMHRHSQIVGEKLFAFLDGDDYWLQKALGLSNREGKTLLLNLHTGKGIEDWPFEVLAKDGTFLILKDLHLVRCATALGKEIPVLPKNRPLKVLFMACSARDVKPELDFEREENAIFQATDKLPIDIEVDDSGSLEGLRGKLAREDYDVVHLSGHAGIAKDGTPFFIMEDEVGSEHRVSPELLWNEALVKNPPRLLILSGNQTAETPDKKGTQSHETESSFAGELVNEYNVPAVLGWGGKVNNVQAIHACRILFQELSRGRSILNAVQRVRYELSSSYLDSDKSVWPLLRLYAPSILFNALVKEEQKWSPKPQRMKYIYLKNSLVKILEEGFVGRRRQLQDSIRGLNAETGRVGVLLMGTGGLGKSCLAGKIVERFIKHIPIIIHGKFNAITLGKGLKDAFVATQDEKGKKILNQPIEMTDKLAHLCTTSFKEKNYLILLDDFEQNLEGFDKGKPGKLLPESSELLEVLLHYLPFSNKMSKLIITSRYEFSISFQGSDILDTRLEKIWLTGFNKTEQRKKLPGLKNIFLLEHHEIARQLVGAGHGNPRLMEWIDLLVLQLRGTEMEKLAEAVRDKQEEFIQQHVIRELLKKGGESLERFLRWFSIYRIPVLEDGAALVAKKARVKDWKTLLRKGMALSLIEHNQARKIFQVIPLLREELLREVKDHQPCHEAAYAYFKQVCEARETIDPVLTEEWIYHALGCGEEEVASDQGGVLMNYLQEHFAFEESRNVGEWILSEKKQKNYIPADGFLLNELALTISDLNDFNKAIEYFQQALVIYRKIYGEIHENVASILNNIGENTHSLGLLDKSIFYYKKALSVNRKINEKGSKEDIIFLNNIGTAVRESGDPKKAIDFYFQAINIYKTYCGEKDLNIGSVFNNISSAYYDLGEFEKAHNYCQKALFIDREVYGEEHPEVAKDLNTIGVLWYTLGDYDKAIDYYQQSLSIVRTIFGEKHTRVAAHLNNLGVVLSVTGENIKAIDFFQKALEINRLVYGEVHPEIAFSLNNIGMVWDNLEEHKKSINYYLQALSIWKKFYGEKHLSVATTMNNLSGAWVNLGEYKKALDYSQQALLIDKDLFGPNHPDVARDLNNIGLIWDALGKYKKAINYYKKALFIFKNAYKENHPDIARVLCNLGAAYFQKGRISRAKAYFKESYKIFFKFLGAEHTETENVKDYLEACSIF